MAVRNSLEPLQPTAWRPGKIGILPQYTKNGKRLNCTLLEVLDNHIISYDDPETWYRHSRVGKKEGLKRLGRMTVGADSADAQLFTAAYRGLFERAGVMPKRHLASFAVTPDARLAPGTRLYANHFTVGQYVDIWGHTRDHGFQGVMIRWGFRGMPATHGTTKTHRRPGAIGTSGDACVKPGKKMPGHMGSEWRPLRGAQIVRINTAKQVLYINGPSVPGDIGALVYVKDCGMRHKRVENPPFPTYFPNPEEELAEEQFVDNLFRFDEPTIEYAPDESIEKSRRSQSKVRKQTKIKK